MPLNALTARTMQAYASAPSPLVKPGANPSRTDAPGKNFSAFVQEAAGEALSTLKTSERVSVQAIEGKASVQAVVEAVASAEATLQTATAVRDKMVEAYQEILRMPV